MAEVGTIDSARQGGVRWKSGRADQRHNDDVARRGWRSIGLIQESGDGKAGDIDRAGVANETKRALSARVAGRNGDGWLSELRRTNKTFYSPGRTCRSARAGERPIFRRRHVSDAACVHWSIRPGPNRVSQWRWRFSIAIQRHDVGWSGTIYRHMV